MLTFIHTARTASPVSTAVLQFLKPPQWHLGLPEFEMPAENSEVCYKPSLYNHVFTYSEQKGILFNSLNLATALFDAGSKSSIEACLQRPSFTRDDLDAEMFRSLRAGRYILPADVDEHSVVRARLARGRRKAGDLRLTIAPTMGCNFNCTYCFEPEAYRRKVALMTPEVQDSIVNLLERGVAEDGVRSVNIAWFGGEPLLALAAIESLSLRMIEICDRHSVAYSANITSNGFGLDTRAVEILAPCRIDLLKISLDGTQLVHDSRRMLRDGKGTFQRIIGNIVAASDALRIVVRVNVDRSNTEDTAALLELLDSLGLAGKVTIQSAILQHAPANEGLFKIFSSRREFAETDHRLMTNAVTRKLARPEQLATRDHFCNADLQGSYMIGPEAELYACWGDFGDPRKRVGSLLSGSRTNPAYQAEFTSFDPTAHAKCAPCTVMPLCLGGCSYDRLNHGEPQCGVYKFNLDDRIRTQVDGWLVHTTRPEPMQHSL
jgi:uncharacterized protein